ncbi:unnamed protein product [Lampetra planeri]
MDAASQQTRTGVAAPGDRGDGGKGSGGGGGDERHALLSRATVTWLARSLRMPLPAVVFAQSPEGPVTTPCATGASGETGPAEEEETGWDRVRDVFHAQYPYPQELGLLMVGTTVGLIGGFVGSGVPAAQLARERFMERRYGEVYSHRIEAVRAVHNVAIKAFIRAGVPMALRVGFFMTIFNGIGIGLGAYRGKGTVGNYITGGALAGGIMRLSLGPRGFVGGAFIGSVLGLPVGVLMRASQWLSSETPQEKRLRLRREKRERVERDRDERQWATEKLLTFMESSVTGEDDLHQINEILARPPNPGAPVARAETVHEEGRARENLEREMPSCTST